MALQESPPMVDWTDRCCLDECERPVSAQRGGSTRGCAIAYAVRDHSMGKLIYRSRKRKKVGATDSQSPSEHPEADVEVWTMDEHRLGPAGAVDVGSRRNRLLR